MFYNCIRVDNMENKKIYKVKKSVKIILCLLIIILIGFIFGYKKYQEYLYTQTNEYALLQLGYSEDETKLILDKLESEEEEYIISLGYNEFIPNFLNTKYFMFKNLNNYLDQVITKDEDFFKYHGTEGYDYDNIVALVNTHRDQDYYSLDLKTDFSKNYGILANKYYSLGIDYEPDDLVNIDIKYYYGDAKKIRSEVYDAFIEMWNAAYNEGIYLIVISAYRSALHQEEVYNEYKENKGTKYADSIAARAGYSEHQTGLSLDIYSKECTSQATFHESNTYQWLINNSYKYGFILRYPKDKQNITGYNYESWHYRYLGVDLAKKVYESGLTYDEYYAYYMEN